MERDYTCRSWCERFECENAPTNIPHFRFVFSFRPWCEKAFMQVVLAVFCVEEDSPLRLPATTSNTIKVNGIRIIAEILLD